MPEAQACVHRAHNLLQAIAAWRVQCRPYPQHVGSAGSALARGFHTTGAVRMYNVDINIHQLDMPIWTW